MYTGGQYEKGTCNRLNIVQNNGELAGQTVNHFHLHLIPRYTDDKVSVKWEQLELTDEQIAEVQKKLNMQ